MNKELSLRSMFCAEKGKVFVAVDLSQAESWAVAYLANDPNLKYSLKYSDIHKDNAAFLFFPPNSCHPHEWNPRKGAPAICIKCGIEIVVSQRYLSKRVNHAKAYRMRYFKLAQTINKDFDKPPYVTVTNKEAKVLSDAWEFNKKGVIVWWGAIEEELDRNNRTLVTPYGRKRRFFQAWGDDLFREATAFLPQSTISDHTKGKIQTELGIKGGMQEIYYQLVAPYKDHKLVNEKHDSVILEIPIGIAEEIGEQVVDLMERPLVIKDEEFVIPADLTISDRLT